MWPGSRKAIQLLVIGLIVGSAVAQVDIGLIFKNSFEDGGGTPTELPPDPISIAPERPPGYTTSPCDAASFLYESFTPVQYNVDETKIDCLLVSILAGRVLDSQDQPLPGVRVAVKDRPEFGYTLSRTDGRYDLVVNGGGTLTIKYSGVGVLSAQRDALPLAQADLVMDDVVLATLDVNVATVESGKPEMQLVSGSTVVDYDGTRTARLLIPPYTYILAADGSGGTIPVSALDVRITEYTVGPNGPAMMPAILPPTIGYTYAVEFSADQAADQEISFSQPLASYNENFLNFPTGTIVPHGYFDWDLNQWVPAHNGRVVEVLSNSGGTVTLAIDSSGAPASAQQLATLGVHPDELPMLSQLYTPGEKLWRVPLSRFSPHDFNMPLPANAVPPPPPPPIPDDFDTGKSDPRFGQIEYQTQTFQEQLHLTGVPFSLHYSSDRTPGRTTGRNLKIPVTRADVPAGMIGAKVIAQFGGRRNEYDLGASPNQAININWDGKDRYGRPVFGTQRMPYRVSYQFPAVYSIFNIDDVSTEPRRVFGALLSFAGSTARSNLTANVSRDFSIRMSGMLDWRPLGVAGWSPSVHHYYDAAGGVIYKGDGTRQSDGGSGLAYSLNQFAGQGQSSDDGIPATEAFISADKIAVASDGTVYFSEEVWVYDEDIYYDVARIIIRAIDPDGIIRTVIPVGSSEYCSGSGSIDANNLRLGGWDDTSPDFEPIQLAVDNNNRLIFASSTCPSAVTEYNGENYYPFFIFRVEQDGSVTPLAGTSNIENVMNTFYPHWPADEFPMTELKDIEVFPDGTLAVLERHSFHRLEPDGWMRHFGGWGTCGTDGCAADGTPAVDGRIEMPVKMAAMPDGSLIFSGIQSYSNRQNILRRITNDGILQTVVPGQVGRSYYNLVSNPDGSIYAHISNPGHPVRYRVVAIQEDGSTVTIAGEDADKPYWTNNGPARQRRFNPVDMALGPDGALYGSTQGIERIVPGDKPVAAGNTLVASNSGPEVYLFSSTGQHLETRHSLTGGLLWEFAYDPRGYLIGVTDGYGNTTTITRNSEGVPSAITSADNHVTSLTTDVDGYLATSTTPGNAIARFQYAPGGLLNRVESATHDVYSMTYDAEGRLLSVQDPFNKNYTLSRSIVPGGSEVEVTTPTGLKTTYQQTVDENRSVINTVTGPSGLQATSTIETDGRITRERADGVVTVTTMAPDPRFAMQSPYPAIATVEFPGGTKETQTQSRTATLQNTGSYLDLLNLTQTLKLGTEVTSIVFDGNTNQQTVTSPTGMIEIYTIDEQGSLVGSTGSALPELASLLDGQGRVTRVNMGETAEQRSILFDYDAQGLLKRMTAVNGFETDLIYDTDLRVVEMILPDGATQHSGFDASGFEVSVTPPDGEAVLLAPDARKSLSRITYPDAGNGATQTTFQYDDDKRSVSEARANAAVLTNTFNTLGQLSSLDYSAGQLAYSYDALSGQKTKIIAPDVTLERVYDGPWLAQEDWSGAVTGSVERLIDSNRVRTKSVSINGVDPIFYGYGPLLASVGSMSMSYHPNSEQLASTSLGLVTDEYQYDSEGRLESYSVKINGVSYYSYDLAFDVMSRIAGIRETTSSGNKELSFNYDNRGNLESVDLNTVNVSSFAYDARGNRIAVTLGATDVVATYDAQDRQLTRGAETFDYDQDGALTARHVGANTTSYLYDEFSNLLQVTLPDSRIIDYVVDGVHRRVERRIDSVRTSAWLYQNNRIAAELDASDQVTSRFVYATFNGAPDYMIRDSRTYRFIKDHLGSVRAVIDTGDGSVVQEITYDNWGQITSDTNPGFQPFGFSGGLFDPLTDLTRLGARDYLAASGRWTTRDPIGFSGGTNFYCYVGNDPVNNTDEEGLLAPLIIIALGLGTAAISENITLNHGTGAGIASSIMGASTGNVLTGGTALPTTLRGMYGGIVSRSPMAFAKAGFGAFGWAAIPYTTGKLLGWGARVAGGNSVDDAGATSDMFGIDSSQLTIGEQAALDELLRRINESDGTNIDELNEAAQRLAVLKNRADERRKGL